MIEFEGLALCTPLVSLMKWFSLTWFQLIVESTTSQSPQIMLESTPYFFFSDSEEEVEKLLTAKRVPKPSVKLVNMQNSSKVMAKPLTKVSIQPFFQFFNFWISF